MEAVSSREVTRRILRRDNGLSSTCYEEKEGSAGIAVNFESRSGIEIA